MKIRHRDKMKIRRYLLIFKVLVSFLVLIHGGCCANTFKHRSIIEMNQYPGLVEGSRVPEWQKYVFDIKVIDEDNNPILQINLYNTLKQEAVSTHALLYGSSFGRASMDGPGVSANVITGLWEEQTMKRARGAIYIKIHMEKEFQDIEGELPPGSYKITAQYVCYKWAKSISKTSLPRLLTEALKEEEDNWSKDSLNIAFKDFSLWDLKTDQWEGFSPATVKPTLLPYRVGRYLVVPVEVQMEKPDFESSCL